MPVEHSVEEWKSYRGIRDTGRLRWEREEGDTSEFGQRKTERVCSVSEHGNEQLEHPNTRPQENTPSWLYARVRFFEEREVGLGYVLRRVVEGRVLMEKRITWVLKTLNFLRRACKEKKEKGKRCSIRKVGGHLKYKKLKSQAFYTFSCAACPIILKEVRKF